MADKNVNVSTIKVRANALMKNGNYVEAIMEYSEGITLQPANPLLYSNRSLAFLKLSQYFFALKDAETTIRLVPDWPKGYYRKGQAEVEAGMFESAIHTFDRGLRVCSGDEILLRALADARVKEREYLLWKRRSLRNACIFGATFGTLLVISDMIFFKSSRPFLKTALIRWIFVFAVTALAYVFRTFSIAVDRASKAALLDPPADLSNSNTNTSVTASQSDTEYRDCLSDVPSRHLIYE